jgi:hypothetical protein
MKTEQRQKVNGTSNVRRHGIVLRIFATVLATTLPAAALADDESTSERIARIANLSPQQKEELAQKKKRFDDLPTDEKERLRQLQQELAVRSDADQLVAVMQQYHEWLKTLSTNQLADLRNLPDDKRVEHIKSLVEKQRKEQEQKTWRRLAEQASPEDLETIFNWLGQFVQKHRDALIRAFPGDFGKRLAAIEDKDRQTLILIHLMLSSQRFGPGIVRPGEKDVQELYAKLSGEAKKFFDSTTDFPRRIQLISIWSRAALWSKAFPNVTSEQLANFFDKLPAPERDRLEAMPQVERDSELRWMYARVNFFRRGEFGDRPPWENREGGRPRRGPREEGGSKRRTDD